MWMLWFRKTGCKDIGIPLKRESFFRSPQTLIIATFSMKNHPIVTPLFNWYARNSRKLPWRETRNPYYIWLSEVILQQTRVDQGLAYYYKFVETFPTISELANAPLDEVLHCWQGLGYYSRARNLHIAAKQVVDRHGGVFPETYAEIEALKGIGPYTAAAISSIAFNLPHAVVDGNVYRFFARQFGIATPIDSTEGKRVFQELADSLIDQQNPALFNQAVMEFGATVCKPASPVCGDCVVSASCEALKAGTIQQLPVKQGKTAVRKRWFNYLVLIDSMNQTLIRLRSAKDIWEGLYEFPLIETPEELSEDEWLSLPEVSVLLKDKNSTLIRVSPPVKHILSHQILNTRFIHVRVKNLPQETFPASIRVSTDQLPQFPFPRLITRFLEDFKC